MRLVGAPAIHRAVITLEEPIRPDAIHDPFAWVPGGGFLSAWELQRAAGVEGLVRRWFAGNADLHGNRYCLCASRGIEDPYRLVEVAWREGGWTVLADEEVPWLTNNGPLDVCRGELVPPHTLSEGTKAERSFPRGLSWHLVAREGEEVVVSLPYLPATYRVRRRRLSWRELPPTQLQLAAEDRAVLGKLGDDHALGHGEAKALLDDGAAVRFVLTDEGKVIALEGFRVWEDLWAGDLVSVEDVLACCAAGLLGDADGGPEGEREYRERFIAGYAPQSRAELVVHTRLFWEEEQRIRTAMRAVTRIRDAEARRAAHAGQEGAAAQDGQ